MTPGRERRLFEGYGLETVVTRKTLLSSPGYGRSFVVDLECYDE